MTSRIKIEIPLSVEARQSHAVQTGQVLQARTSFDLDLSNYSPEERARLVKGFGIDADSVCPFNFGPTADFRASVIPADRESWLQVLAEAETFRARIVAQQAEDEARRQAERQKRVAQAKAEIERWEAATNDELMAQWEQYGRQYFIARPEGLSDDDRRRIDALQSHCQAIANTREAAVKAEKARRQAEADAERLAWINEHGSEFLRKAVAAGYNCQRRYVTERAMLEHPGAAVDFEDAANWKARSCPSETALDLAIATNGTVVWMTAPPRTCPDDAHYECCFEDCEAVLVENYLGKNDLYYYGSALGASA